MTLTALNHLCLDVRKNIMTKWGYWIDKDLVINVADVDIDFSLMSMPPYFVTNTYDGVDIVLTWETYVDFYSEIIPIQEAYDSGYKDNLPPEFIKMIEFQKQIKDVLDGD